MSNIIECKVYKDSKIVRFTFWQNGEEDNKITYQLPVRVLHNEVNLLSELIISAENKFKVGQDV